jgi:putative PEP-CTERM system TPR-repeat lipoprotein
MILQRVSRCSDRSIAVGLVIFAMTMAAPLLAEEKSDPLIAKVTALAAKGDAHSAEIEIKRAIVAEPQRGDLRVVLAKIHLQMGRLSDAEQDLKMAEERGQDPNLLLPRLAELWLAQGDSARVLRELQPNDRMAPDLKARVFALRATAQIARQQFDEASRSIDAALQTGAAQQHEVLMAEAQYRLALDQPAAAETLLDKLLASTPNDLDALMMKAVIRLRVQDLPGAVALYDQALVARPQAAMPRIDRAVALLSLNRVDEASKDVEILRKSLPNNPQVRLLEAETLAARDKIADAWEALRPVIPDLSHNAAAQILAGWLNLLLDNLAQARDFASVAVTLAPDNSQAVRLLAAIEMRDNDAGHAVGLLESLVKKQPRDVGAMADLGEIYGLIGQDEHAAQLFERAATLAPDDQQLQFSRALSEIKAGNLPAAIPFLQAGAAEHQARAGAALTAVYLSQGRLPEARAQAQAYASQEPNNPLAPTLQGRVELADGNLPAAERFFQAALTNNPDFLPALTGLADCAQKAGQFDKALELLQAAAKRRPQDLSVRLALIGAAIATKDIDKALEVTRQAVAELPNSLPVLQAHIELLLRAHHLDAALAAADRLSSQFDTLPVSLALLAKVQFFAAKYSDAIATLRVMAQKVPGAGDLQLAELLFQLGRRQEARLALDAGVKKTPGLFALWELRVDDEMRSHGIAQARQLAEQARKISAPMADLLIGNLMFNNKRYEESLKPYRAALQSADGVAQRQIFERLVAALQRARHDDEAQKLMIDWLDRHKADLSVRQALADFYFTRHQTARALAEYQKILDSDPNNVVVLNNVALLHAERQEFDKGLAAARRAHTYAPASAAVSDSLGWLLLQSGNLSESLALLKGANDDRNGNDPSIAYHYAVALSKQGDKAMAVGLLTKLTNAPAFAEQTAATALLRTLNGAKSAPQSRH